MKFSRNFHETLLVLWALLASVSSQESPGVFPRELKHVVVYPLLKKPTLDPRDPASYCPVPQLAFLVKSGTCPALQSAEEPQGTYCSLDADCPGSEKCCETRDGQRCALPNRVISGYCPKAVPKPGQATTCMAECDDDFDCDEGLPIQKCCSFGKWRLCITAVEEHPGVCPLRPVDPNSAPCRDTCNDDRDCHLTQKCCFTGCGRGCLDAVRSEQCRLPPELGSCNASLTRYYYNPEEKTCLDFTYGGCGGNSNNFKTKDKCEEACGKISPEVCDQPPEKGPCLDYLKRYYYDSSSKSCKIFIYGGCGGNGNRFRSKLGCLMVCGRPGKCVS